MLLSMYVAYHLSEISRESKRIYVLLLVGFIALASFLSTIAALPLGIFLGLVTPAVSFPAYGIYDEFPSFKLPEEGFSSWIWISKASFMMVEVGRIVEPVSFPLVFLFYFIFVNATGAVFGYELSRIRRIRDWGNQTKWNLVGFVSSLVLLIAGFLISGVNYVETGKAPVGGGQYVDYSVTRYPYSNDGWAFFLFGIIILGIVVIRIVSERLQARPSQDKYTGD